MHSEQAVWLDKVLAENKLPWVVCSFHHPIFSTAKDRDNAALRAAWKPVFDKYRVDLVLQGHDHSYGRTGLETPVVVPETVGNVPTGVTNVDTETGTIYVVSVSGPKMYNLHSNQVMKRVAEDTQLYQIIEIAGDRLRYEARTATGELYDAFSLTKVTGKVNVLEEQMPLMPERRRPPMPASTPSQPEAITVPQPAGKPAPTTAP
jgi:3',5'-cyclic AMP phosphodiesterase CpdA